MPQTDDVADVCNLPGKARTLPGCMAPDGAKPCGTYVQLRVALIEAREALATLDAPNGKDSGLATIRGGRPIKQIIDEALSQ